MLVLSRKIDESIMIGDSVVIKVLSIQDGQVKIGIEAPKEVKNPQEGNLRRNPPVECSSGESIQECRNEGS